MVKRRTGGEKPYKTDFSFADRYIDDRRVPIYVPIRAKFPLIEDRRAANINWNDQEPGSPLHRSYRGNIPGPGVDHHDLGIGDPGDFSDGEYQFTSNAPNASNIPYGYKGTTSGIVPIEESDIYGPSSDNPLTVNSEFENDAQSAEFIVGMNIETSNMRGERYPYTGSYAQGVGRFEWELNGYISPTEPEARFPKGARRKRTFKY